MKQKRRSRYAAFLLTLTMLTGLLPSAGAEGEPPLSVTLTGLGSSATVGETQTVTANVSDSSADPAPSYAWSCTPADHAEVPSTNAASASVTFLKVGNVTIQVIVTATVGGVSRTGTAEQSVTVSAPSATSVTVTPDTLTLEEDSSGELYAAVEPTGAEGVVWSSDNETVATVGQDGRVTGHAAGSAEITARSGGQSDSATVEVSGLTLSTPEAMVEGNSQTLTATPHGAAKGLTVDWTSSREEIVRTQGGKLTALAEGEAVITAATSDGRYRTTCTVTVAANTAGVITADADAGHPLAFSSVERQMQDRCRDVLGSSLDHVTGLSVPTSAGILFHKYVSADDPGFGVGSMESYYVSSDYQKLLSDITFVPAGSFSGTAEIGYTGYASDGRSFKGSIRVSVEAASDVVYSTGANTPVDLSVGDFNTVCRGRTSRDLGYVVFTLPSESRGVLYYKYSSGSTYNIKADESTRYGRASAPYLSDLTLVPAQDYTGAFTIPYTCYDTSGYSFGGRVSVTVSKGGATGGSGDVNYSTARNKAVTFKASDFNTACKNATGRTLERVSFDPPPSSRGTLYYDYTSSGDYDSRVQDGDRYYRTGSPGLSRVTFVPARDFDGTVTFDFTGWDDDGTRFTGTVEIAVGSNSSGDVTYSTPKNTAVDFSAADFNAVCRDATGEALERVRFTPPASSRGVLYYGYTSSGDYDSRVRDGTSYYRGGSPNLSDVTFVPAKNYEGTVTIDFNGWAEDDTRFSGTVEIDVGSGSSRGVVSYSTAKNKAVDFKTADFNDACRDANNRSLDYVRFELPSDSRGTLYTGYSSSSGRGERVSDSTKYHRSGSPALSSVTFVPAEGYTGTVSIGFTGYDSDGERFNGTVEIDVGGGSDPTIPCRVISGKTLVLDDADFSEVCRDQVGGALRYVRFTQPSASQGTLYYSYTGSASDTKVSDSRSYYKSADPYLSKVSFVPAAGFTGAVRISFTGYNTSGDKFTGALEITVEPGPSAAVIRYSTGGLPVVLQPQDFAAACGARGEGSFSTARFALPSASCGRLYYGYAAPSQYEGVVNASTEYAGGGSRDLAKVSFLPNAGFSGTAVVTYTGADSDGATYEGRVEISVAPAAYSSRFSDLGGYTWAAASVDFLSEYGVVSGAGAGRFAPGVSITRGDFILMLHRAFRFQGADGENFSDVPADSYYAGAVAAAKALGIAQGGADGLFHPAGSLTRQDAAVFLQRAMRSVGWSLSDGSASSLSYYPDGNAVSPYAVGAMGCMVQHGVLRGDGNGRLNPTAVLSRGEMAVILHRALTL